MLSTPEPTLTRPTSAPDVGVVVAARHPAMRKALWAVVEAVRGVAPIGAAGDLHDATTLLDFTQPELVLVDTSVIGGPALPGLATLQVAAPHAAIVVIGTGDHPSYAAHARAAGAFDCVLVDDAVDQVPEALLAARALVCAHALT
jgi:DNA-binding NarL/FixJ family response regulator